MLDVVVIALAFASIFVVELPDKTFIATSVCTKNAIAAARALLRERG